MGGDGFALSMSLMLGVEQLTTPANECVGIVGEVFTAFADVRVELDLGWDLEC
jgi:hypothetical protein